MDCGVGHSSLISKLESIFPIISLKPSPLSPIIFTTESFEALHEYTPT